MCTICLKLQHLNAHPLCGHNGIVPDSSAIQSPPNYAKNRLQALCSALSLCQLPLRFAHSSIAWHSLQYVLVLSCRYCDVSRDELGLADLVQADCAC